MLIVRRQSTCSEPPPLTHSILGEPSRSCSPWIAKQECAVRTALSIQPCRPNLRPRRLYHTPPRVPSWNSASSIRRIGMTLSRAVAHTPGFASPPRSCLPGARGACDRNAYCRLAIRRQGGGRCECRPGLSEQTLDQRIACGRWPREPKPFDGFALGRLQTNRHRGGRIPANNGYRTGARLRQGPWAFPSYHARAVVSKGLYARSGVALDHAGARTARLLQPSGIESKRRRAKQPRLKGPPKNAEKPKVFCPPFFCPRRKAQKSIARSIFPCSSWANSLICVTKFPVLLGNSDRN